MIIIRYEKKERQVEIDNVRLSMTLYEPTDLETKMDPKNYHPTISFGDLKEGLPISIEFSSEEYFEKFLETIIAQNKVMREFGKTIYSQIKKDE